MTPTTETCTPRKGNLGRARRCASRLVAFLLVMAFAPLFFAEEAASGSGRATVFAVGASASPRKFSAQVVQVAAVAAGETPGDPGGGAETALPLEATELRSRPLSRRQVRLASGPLPAGRYRGLHVVLELTPPRKRRMRAADGAEAPPVDEAAPAPPVLDLQLDGDFLVRDGETVTISLEWDLAQAFDAEGAPVASALYLRRPQDTVRGLTLYVTDERGDQVIAVNRGSLRVFASLQVGRRPRGIAASQDGRRVYVANSGDDSVSVIDPATHQVIDRLLLPGGSRPEDVVVADDGRRLVVSSPGTAQLAIYDTFSNSLLAEVELSRDPGRLALSPDGRTVYALLPTGSQLVAVDVLRPTGTPRVVPVDARPRDVAVDARGTIFVTYEASPTLGVFEADLRRSATLQVGVASHGVALEPGGRRLYLTGGQAGGISLVAADLGATARRWITPAAYFVAVDPDGQKLFATGGPRGTLLVLDRIAGRRIEEIPVGSSAFDLVVVP